MSFGRIDTIDLNGTLHYALISPYTHVDPSDTGNSRMPIRYTKSLNYQPTTWYPFHNTQIPSSKGSHTCSIDATGLCTVVVHHIQHLHDEVNIAHCKIVVRHDELLSPTSGAGKITVIVLIISLNAITQ